MSASVWPEAKSPWLGMCQKNVSWVVIVIWMVAHCSIHSFPAIRIILFFKAALQGQTVVAGKNSRGWRAKVRARPNFPSSYEFCGTTKVCRHVIWWWQHFFVRFREENSTQTQCRILLCVWVLLINSLLARRNMNKRNCGCWLGTRHFHLLPFAVFSVSFATYIFYAFQKKIHFLQKTRKIALFGTLARVIVLHVCNIPTLRFFQLFLLQHSGPINYFLPFLHNYNYLFVPEPFLPLGFSGK